MRIFVCGNCQLDALTPAIQAALSLAGVSASIKSQRFSPNIFPTVGLEERLAALRSQFDFVITNQADLASLLSTSKIETIVLPDLFFHGFQPDVCYLAVSDPKNQPVIFFNKSTAMSLLVTWGWRNGWSTKQTEALFNSEVFGNLGYYDAFRQSAIALRERSCGMNVEPSTVLFELSRPIRGMHEIWHPTLRVSFALMQDIFKRMSLSLNVSWDDVCDAGVLDTLASECVWPVYPEIGERLGFRGGYVTRKANLVLRGLREFVGWQYLQLNDFTARKGISPKALDVHISGLRPWRTLDQLSEVLQ